MPAPDPAECPCCSRIVQRYWTMRNDQKIGQAFRSHKAPCGLPCKLAKEASAGEAFHEITEECAKCLLIIKSNSEIYVDGKVVNKEDDPRKSTPNPIKPVKYPGPAPEPKIPWDKIVIPPHALKMVKIRAGFESIIDAAMLIERLYPLAIYNSSQKKAHGTSHTKRTMPGKNKNKSQRVDLYTVVDNGIEWIFYMKRNVLMTVHRNDELDFGGPPMKAEE